MTQTRTAAWLGMRRAVCRFIIQGDGMAQRNGLPQAFFCRIGHDASWNTGAPCSLANKAYKIGPMIPIGDDNTGRRTTPWVTWTLIAMNVIVFVFLEGFGANQRFINAYSAVPGKILTGRDIVTRDHIVTDPSTGQRFLVPGLQHTPVPMWLTILTSMFMHAGIAHIAGNMLYLFIFGDNIEDRLGHFRYLLFYLFCGVVASLSQVYVTELTHGDLLVPSLGASGAIAGVLGGYLLLFPRNRVRVLMFRFITSVPAIFAVGIWFLFQVIAELGVLGQDTGGGVAYAAHIGGFAAGFITVKPWGVGRRA
jgi:membrane associated rhomboid family serine protease